MNLKRAFLALGAMILGVGFFGASAAHAAEGYITPKFNVGHGVMCEGRQGGTVWPVKTPIAGTPFFFYCGTSTAASRGFDAYNPLKGISNGEPSIEAQMTNHNVVVYVMDSPQQYATMTGQNPQTVWTDMKTQKHVSYSAFVADGNAQNAIYIFERIPDPNNAYPALVTFSYQDHVTRHELGHHFDLYFGSGGNRLSNSTIFNNLYPDDTSWEASHNPQTVADNVAYAYWWHNKKELFAEEFAIATGSVAYTPLDPDTTNYFKCTYRFVNNWKMNQANPPAGTYASQCTP